MAQPANSLYNALTGLSPAHTPASATNDQREQRRMLKRLIDQFERDTDALVDALVAGLLGLAGFAAAMRSLIKRLHLTAAMVGQGEHPVTPQTLEAAQQQVDAQLVYFNDWMREMQGQMVVRDRAVIAGLVTAFALSTQTTTARAFISGAQIAARAHLYGGAARETQARIYLTARGLPQMPFNPGDRTRCHRNCACFWSVIKLKGMDNFDVYWTLGFAEHCPTCLARSRVCNPLRVRNGAIVNPGRYTMPNLYA